MASLLGQAAAEERESGLGWPVLCGPHPLLLCSRKRRGGWATGEEGAGLAGDQNVKKEGGDEKKWFSILVFINSDTFSN